MKVKQILDWAVQGDLRQLSVAEISDDDPEREENIKTLIGYINQGLIALYGRYGLKKKTTALADVVNVTSFTLPDDFIVPISAKANNDELSAVPLNDVDADIYLEFTDPVTVEVYIDWDRWSNITQIDLRYSALPTFVEDENSVVPLPVALTDPLLKHMAFTAHSTLSSANNDDEEDKYFQRYENACQRADLDGSITTENTGNWKATDRGYP